MKTKLIRCSRHIGRPHSWLALLACVLSVPILPAQPDPNARVLSAHHHHLGIAEAKEDWSETTAMPEGPRLELKFTAAPNTGEVVLGVRQRDVSDAWALRLNGKQIATLKRHRDPKVSYYAVPAGTLRDGENTLVIESKTGKDNIVVGPIALHQRPLREVLELSLVTLNVSDARSGRPVPARITITDLQDEPVEIFNAIKNETAVRLGVVYTAGTETWVELPRGEYNVYATRGMEWSRPQTRISVRPGTAAKVALRLEREVDTRGFIAADTHIHTLTFSGHGDSNLEERMLTLAGEGVELAVATDHNHNTDYAPYQEKMGLTDYFTPVVGNEVTTAVGHINAFPLDARESPPNHKLNDWVQIVDGIRAKGAKVVILNHPRWPSLPRSPLTQFGLNRASGDFRSEVPFPFDGMELANALTPQPDPLFLFEDWFALLNRGHKVAAVGSSDSHTVGQPVGQGRTYIPSLTDDPAKIDVDNACDRFLRGEASISLGIFADVLVDGRYKMGHTVPVQDGSVQARLRVAAPSWITPRRALVFLNGRQVAEKPVLAGSPRRPTNVLIDFAIKPPPHDAHLVCVVLGDGASHPSWRTAERFTLAATNPVFLDADGDGQYRSPRETARQFLDQSGGQVDRQWQAVNEADDVIAVQMLSLLREQGAIPDWETRARELAAKRPLLSDYLAMPLPPIKVTAEQLR
ncbi:MAG: PHP domain-containing protein [Verrucomicrobiae bacterium]|nr:PHP domain-containing protein [Verrucomicrobiae bacterium]